jgi:hypothetical protein
MQHKEGFNMREKTELYTIVWSQLYPDWNLVKDDIIEVELEHENFAEAKAELDRIMKL